MEYPKLEGPLRIIDSNFLVLTGVAHLLERKACLSSTAVILHDHTEHMALLKQDKHLIADTWIISMPKHHLQSMYNA